jgi:hypothetical protein
MKKLLLLSLTLLACTMGFAQQTFNFTVFSMDGDAFTLILNGERMNTTPVTNIKVTDVVQPSNKVRVIFADQNKPPVEKTIYGEPGMEYSMEVKKNNKGEMVLRLVSQTSIAQAPPAPANQTVIVWGQPQPAATTTTVVEETVTTTTVGTTTNVGTTSTGTSDNFNMSMNVGGVSMDVNVNASENGMNTNMGVTDGMGGATTTQTSTTVVTTTTSGTTSGTTPVVTSQPVATSGCVYGMDASSFQSAKNSISSKTFEDSKITTAKQALKSNCMTSAQIKEVMGLFTYEESKLDFAKFAYSYCVDPQNYYLVNDAFGFETSIEELDSYIQSTR